MKRTWIFAVMALSVSGCPQDGPKPAADADAGPAAQAGEPDAAVQPGEPDAAVQPGEPDAAVQPGEPDAAVTTLPADGPFFVHDLHPGEANTVGNRQPALAVGPGGRIHLAFKTAGEDVPSLMYATCATGCDGPAGWTTVDLGPTGATPVAIAVDGQDRPRILHTVYEGSEGADVIRYLACDVATCTAASSWKALDVALVAPNSEIDGVSSFTLDAAGRPAFVYRWYGAPLHFARCAAADCTASGSWADTVISSATQASDMALAFDGLGSAHLVYRGPGDDEGNPLVVYYRCAVGCDGESGWVGVLAFHAGATGPVRVRSDAIGRTRIVAFSGYDGDPADSLFYAACDAGCDELVSWSLQTVGLDPFDARLGLDLAVDASAAPRLAFSVQGAGIPVGVQALACTATECTIDTVEAASALPPVAVPPTCPTTWSSGADVKTALLPSGRQIFVYSTEVHSVPGHPGCDVPYARHLVRVAIR